MSALPVEGGARPGDQVTISGTIRKVWGPGPHAALIETPAGGLLSIALVVDGHLPDPNVVISKAPPPAVVHEVRAEGCTCGR